MIIVSDTSPISNLIAIGKLEILYKTLGKIIIPVAEEIRALALFKIDLSDFESVSWISIQSPTNIELVNELRKELDAGESEAIALSIELNAAFVLMDENIGRNIAKKHNIQSIGLLGILIKAKERRIIPKIKPIIEDLKEIAGFWVSDNVVKKILKIANE